ncbi:MAG TPA: MFS transporter [Candidatus Limnocylindria bacterium]|nr:MFS transporter [Candidatus Limnocylindria bacterium]
MNRLGHRDLLLTLKYSTIEACFSVPMLNLTMPSFAFVIAFAVSVLGWPPEAIGLAAALPHLCNFIQPAITAALQRVFSLHQVMCLSFIFSALPWGLVSLLPWLKPAQQGLFFGGLLLVATLSNSIGSVSWSAAIAEVVPERLSGKYFGRRNLLFGTWTLLVVLFAGYMADRGGKTLITFGWIFAAAGASRLLGLFFLMRMKFPASVMTRTSRALNLDDLKAVFRDSNYLWFIVFIGLWGMLLNMGMPFYTMFLMDGLGFSVSDVVKLTTVGSLGGILTLKAWGLLSDRFGSKPVLIVAATAWSLVALAAWSLAGPTWRLHLYASYLIVGGTTAGLQLCQFNLMVKLVPAARRAAYVSTFFALTSLLTALGPALGGWLLGRLPDHLGVFLGQPIRDYHVVFGLSLLGCLFITNVLHRVREPAEQPVGAVWRTMRTMRSFNPMLALATMGELLITPNGLIGLARRSVRTVKRQVKVLSDVGEELVEGGQDVLKAPFERRD